MAGQGSLTTRNPPVPGGTGLPVRSTTSTTAPGTAFPTNPGFIASPIIVVAMCIPVSVCHQVSTMGHRPPPIR